MKFTFKRYWIFIIVLSLSLLKGRDIVTVTSPDKDIKVEFNNDSGVPKYEVNFKNKTIVAPSNLGLIRKDGDFTQGMGVDSIYDITKVTQEYVLKHGHQKNIEYFARRKKIGLKNSYGKKMDIIFQVSNDGVALRYSFPDTTKNIKEIKEEKTEFRFDSATKNWIQPLAKPGTGWNKTQPSYEEDYVNGENLAEIDSEFGWVFPALFKSKKIWIILSESASYGDYCGSRLSQTSDKKSFEISLATREEVIPGKRAKPASHLPWKTPWRIIGIGNKLGTIVESNLATDLAQPNVLGDTSFVEPGQASWSWVMYKDDSTVYDVQKRFIDFASEMNWEYCLIDCYWDQQIGFDKIKKLSSYAQNKDVELFLWYNSAGQWNTTPLTPRNKLLTHEKRLREFNKLQQAGIRGIKVDFFGGDGQSMINYYLNILKDAAKHDLMVNFHGCTIPRGWHRTFPNLVTMESVKGFEYVTFNQEVADRQPVKCTILPFTRNVFSPMDFTPMAFEDPTGINRKTTDAFELALSVLFYSGVQHFAATPQGMKSVPQYVKNILQRLPDFWQETEFVAGYPGQYVALARKYQNRWYIAGINGQNKSGKIKLDFSFINNYNKVNVIRSAGKTDSLEIKENQGLPNTMVLAPQDGFLIEVVK